jgi:hypothetical protein
MDKDLTIAVLSIFGLFVSGFGQVGKMQSLSLNKPPVIDGHLETGEWQVTDSQTVFIQMEPQKGLPATERTILFAGFDEENVYFAFKCYDRDAGKIVCNIYTRDKLEKSDDAVFVILDTYFDRRSCYSFILNPAGTQTDMRIVGDSSHPSVLSTSSIRLKNFPQFPH